MSILLVDDSAAQRLALAQVLEQGGYDDLYLAGSAAEALRCLGADNPGGIDLILMDLHMPGVNGIEACRQIKAVEQRQDIPVIMVTSSDEAEDLEQAFANGALDYIIKPPDEAKLLARVRSALRLKRETDERKRREQELRRLNQRLEQVLIDLDEKHRLLQEAQDKSERLLLNILPAPVAARLKEGTEIVAQRFEAVTVLFADLVDFTPLAARVSPEALVRLLNEVFSFFDALADRHGLEKIKTIGDAYMAVAGLPVPRADHARAAADMALEIQKGISQVGDGTLRARLGLHSGPVIAGVIGQRKFSYDLWGDTVNIASRMEAQGVPGAIQVTAETHALLRPHYSFAERGRLLVKGRGELCTYLLTGRKAGEAQACSEPDLRAEPIHY